MSNIFTFSLLAATFGFGILCLRSPIKVSYTIIKWVKFASSGKVQNSSVRKAIDLIEQDPGQYEKEFSAHLATIRRTGYIALIVALLGFCLALLPS
jgi:hypothetical protein